MTAALDYVSGGINPKCNNASWGPEWLAFGIGPCVALARIGADSARIERLLQGHKNTVNAVSWISAHALLSASVDRSVRLWLREESGSFRSRELRGHEGPVTDVTGIEEDGGFAVASCAADGLARFLQLRADAVAKEQSLRAPQGGLCLCVKLSRLPDASLLLLCAFTNCRVVCFARPRLGADLEPTCVLSGHTDWVRGLTCFPAAEGNCLWLASAAQDRSVRLWAIESAVEAEIEAEDVLKPRQLRLKSESEATFAVRLEAVLAGHEDAVTGATWFSGAAGLKLLTCSKDKAAVVWSKGESGLW